MVITVPRLFCWGILLCECLPHACSTASVCSADRGQQGVPASLKPNLQTAVTSSSVRAESAVDGCVLSPAHLGFGLVLVFFHFCFVFEIGYWYDGDHLTAELTGVCRHAWLYSHLGFYPMCIHVCVCMCASVHLGVAVRGQP